MLNYAPYFRGYNFCSLALYVLLVAAIASIISFFPAFTGIA
jgi:hypothetical protein